LFLGLINIYSSRFYILTAIICCKL